MFIDTLPSPYYDKVMGSVASNFVDLVVVDAGSSPRHAATWVSLRSSHQRKERRGQRRVDRAYLLIKERGSSLVSSPVRHWCRVDGFLRYLTTNVLRRSLSATSRHRSSHHSKASIARHEKAT
ncbi:hypothetical protein CR513_49949, partial [Mucuna pruriens]